MSDQLLMYTVYRKPSDFPDSYVVRRWAVSAGAVAAETGLWCLADSLEGARQSIPPGAFRLDRNPADDPVIVEVWL